MARRYLIGLEYIGTSFSGSATSKVGKPGVQNVVEGALKEVFLKKIETSWACRTDAGSHAFFNVFQFDLSQPVGLTPGKMVKKILQPLNLAVLDHPIRLHSVCEVPKRFSCADMCRARTYLYRMSTCPTIPVQPMNDWQRLWTCGYRHKFNLDEMREAAKVFIGEHDYSTFTTKKGIESNASTIRSIDKIEIYEASPLNFSSADLLPRTRLPQYVHIEITGRTFLHQQVFRMVGCLYQAGRGLLAPKMIKSWLEARNRKAMQCSPAPPHGAYLKKVEYNEKYVKWAHLDHEYDQYKDGISDGETSEKKDSSSTESSEV